ncbi:MAG: U32 family peptidase C-terminal domain-containing protein [Fibrobacterales bacterium]
MSELEANLEVLAPAGDLEKMKYALAFGADAVYAGQPRYSLRARENGFKNIDDIAEGIEYAHGLGKKFYLTSNIIPHNIKINSFKENLSRYVEHKPDAIIMTDPGMIAYVKEKHPDQEVHLSVQANCTNWSTAKFWQSIGVSRVILSRELRIKEIKEIKDACPDLELESFVHGAVCMAYSGRCMLSNYMTFRDSNQGMCSNACRLKYSMYEKNALGEEEYTPIDGEFYIKETDDPNDAFMLIDEDEHGTYMMNSRDMCAIEHLKDLAEAGICSFKIEGRTKSIYYLSQVSKAYRNAVDDVIAGRPFNPAHKEMIEKTDSRGFFPGFFEGKSEVLPQNYDTTRLKSATSQVLAQVRDYDPETKLATISVKGQIKEGQKLELMIPGENTFFEAKHLHNHKRKRVEKVDSGLDGCKIHLEEAPKMPAFVLAVK